MGKHGPDRPRSSDGQGWGGGSNRGKRWCSGRAATAAKVEYECPICIDNADDADGDGVGPAQCFACGQLVCGQCKLQTEANDTNCPTCRAPYDVPDTAHTICTVQPRRGVCQWQRRAARRHPSSQVDQAAADSRTGRPRCGVCHRQRCAATKAVKWMQLSAEQGNAHAMTRPAAPPCLPARRQGQAGKAFSFKNLVALGIILSM